MTILNRAQVVGLYGLMMNLPLDTEAHLEWPNNSYGDLPLRVVASDGTNAQWKLGHLGGSEMVSGSVPARVPLDDPPGDDDIIGYDYRGPVRREQGK